MTNSPYRKIYTDKSRAFNAEFIDNLPVGIYRTTLLALIRLMN